MALKRYIKSLGKLRNPCEMCSAATFAERFRFRPHQYVPDHIPKILTVCKKCLYREALGSRGLAKKMKENVLKDEGNA